jgi:hypothetical protein
MATGYLILAALILAGIIVGQPLNSYILAMFYSGLFFLPGAALWQVFSSRRGVFERLAQVGIIAAGLVGFMAMLACLPMLSLESFFADPRRAVSIFENWWWWVYLTVSAAMAALALWPWLWVKTRRGYLAGGYLIIVLGWYLPSWLYPRVNPYSSEFANLGEYMVAIAGRRPDLGLLTRAYRIKLPEGANAECPLCGIQVEYIGPFGLVLCTYAYSDRETLGSACL